MKKNLFWKVMAVLFFLWLCVWLWNSSIFIYQKDLASVRHNKLTGTIDVYYINNQPENTWRRVEPAEGK